MIGEGRRTCSRYDLFQFLHFNQLILDIYGGSFLKHQCFKIRTLSIILSLIHYCQMKLLIYLRIVGSVVECSPATRAARVRFPDDAIILKYAISYNYFVTKWCLIIK